MLRNRETVRNGLWQAAQILVAAVGGFLFNLLDVPAAWLSGSVVAVGLLCATRRAVPMSPSLTDAAMLLAGTSMGAAATPEALAAFARYPTSLMLLALSIVAVVATSGLWLGRLSRWNRLDALLASMPGALSTVMAVAADRNASVGPIAVVQSFRLAVLVVVLPSVLFALGGGEGTVVLEGVAMSAGALGALLLLGWGVGEVLRRLGMAAPLLLGTTLVSGTGHALGLVDGLMPPSITTFGLVLLGCYIGLRFRTVDRHALVASMPAAFASFILSIIVASAFAFAAAGLAHVPFGTALIAFAPGGLEAMTVLALIMGFDPIFVGSHHLARFLGIGLALPVIVGWMGRRRRA